MVKPRTCECCGRPIPEIEVMAELTRTQGRILLILDKAGTAGIHLAKLTDKLYEDDPDGGPLNAVSCIRTMRSKMEPVLKKFGMKIATQRGGNWKLDVL